MFPCIFGVSLQESQEGLVCEVILADLDVMPTDDCEDVRSNRSLQWRRGEPLRWRERGILAIYYPLLVAASLQEGGDSRGGEVLKMGVGENLEGVSIRGHVVSLIDQF